MRLVARRAGLNRTFEVNLFIKNDIPDQRVTLLLPATMELDQKEFKLYGFVYLAYRQKSTQIVPPPGESGYSQVTWRVRATQLGTYTLTARHAGGTIAKEEVCVRQMTYCDFD